MADLNKEMAVSTETMQISKSEIGEIRRNLQSLEIKLQAQLSKVTTKSNKPQPQYSNHLSDIVLDPVIQSKNPGPAQPRTGELWSSGIWTGRGTLVLWYLNWPWIGELWSCGTWTGPGQGNSGPVVPGPALGRGTPVRLNLDRPQAGELWSWSNTLALRGQYEGGVEEPLCQ